MILYFESAINALFQDSLESFMPLRYPDLLQCNFLLTCSKTAFPIPTKNIINAFALVKTSKTWREKKHDKGLQCKQTCVLVFPMRLRCYELSTQCCGSTIIFFGPDLAPTLRLLLAISGSGITFIFRSEFGSGLLGKHAFLKFNFSFFFVPRVPILFEKFIFNKMD